MAWIMTPVAVPPSAVKTPLDQIPQDVKDSVDEAFAYVSKNPGERLIAAFETQADAERNRGLIRSYCEARPAGRLTASIWQGFAGAPDGEDLKFSPTETEVCATPALSLAFTPYVKRVKSAAGSAGSDNPPAATPGTE